MTKIQYITRCDRATLICLVVKNERCASAPVTAAICHNGAPVVRNQLHLRHTTGMVHTEELQSFKRLLAIPVTKPHWHYEKWVGCAGTCSAPRSTASAVKSDCAAANVSMGSWLGSGEGQNSTWALRVATIVGSVSICFPYISLIVLKAFLMMRASKKTKRGQTT